jgi:hypothetical protein
MNRGLSDSRHFETGLREEKTEQIDIKLDAANPERRRSYHLFGSHFAIFPNVRVCHMVVHAVAEEAKMIRMR